MSKVRSFLAIEIESRLKDNIAKVTQEFKKIDSDIKFVSNENLHLTLKFFGNIDDFQLKQIKSSISLVLRDFNMFNIKLGGVGAFPNKNHIKVIWIGMEDNEILYELQFRLDDEFAKLGFNKEKNFKSHLTIGRMKTGKNKNKVKKIIEKNENIIIGDFSVKSICLKKSNLTPSGPIYETLEEFIL